MRNNLNNTEKDFKSALRSAGVDVAAVVNNLDEHLSESKRNFQTLSRLMDARTRLTGQVKLLELELFIQVLKKV